MPATLNDAIATEPIWLQAWVMVLVVVNLAALLFVIGRRQGRRLVRPEPIAIVASFLAAGVFMGWLYAQVGYVRLLGAAHLVFWGPVWIWILSRRRAIGIDTLFGKYLHLYLAIAGTSLLIDSIDVIRHLAGDGALLHRWR
jgi:threonine/homoserine efflux transporter RhtA